MSEHESARRDVVAIPEPDGRCQVCGAPHGKDDPIFCAVCGEPVLRWGWAP